MAAQEIAPVQEQLADPATAQAPVNDAGAIKIWSGPAVVARCADQLDRFSDGFPFFTAGANAVVQDDAIDLGLQADAGNFLAVAFPLPVARPARLQTAFTVQSVDVQ